MAKIHAGILGGFNGKVGNVIGFGWKGRAVMRAKAQSVHNPKTPKQELQRAKFALMAHLLDIIGAVPLAQGLGKRGNAGNKRITAGNVFTRINLKNGAVDGSEIDNLSIDYGLVIIADGKVPGFKQRGSATSDDPSTIHVAWDDNSSAEGASAADTVKFVLVNPEADESMTATASRSELSADITVPWAAGESVHLYAYMVGVGSTQGNNQLVSKSHYCGKIVLS